MKMLDDDYDEPLQLWCRLPTEILIHVFTYLPGKELIKCRKVCVRWKNVVDGLTLNDVLWMNYCKNEFKDIFKVARRKSRPGLFWYHIYRSLSLWPKLVEAREIKDEFASASTVNDEIRDFKILRNGEIGVHKRGSIVYYDVQTLQPSKREAITGDYLAYAEDEDIILIMSYHLHLFVIRKAPHNPNLEASATFDNVKSFILADQEVYYVNLNDELYVFKLDNLTSTLIQRANDSVMCLGYKNKKIHLLTYQKNIYTLVDGKLIFTCSLEENINILSRLQKYNFLEMLDWRVYFQWMFVLNHTIPHPPLRDIIVVRSYGDTYFVGTNWGVLLIYHDQHTSGEFDLFKEKPIKQYNFVERCDCPVLTTSPIIQIDILESEDGHTVIVAMPKKIAVLEFIHNFKRTSSAAILPYADNQIVKILKIHESTGIPKIGQEEATVPPYTSQNSI